MGEVVFRAIRIPLLALRSQCFAMLLALAVLLFISSRANAQDGWVFEFKWSGTMGYTSNSGVPYYGPWPDQWDTQTVYGIPSMSSNAYASGGGSVGIRMRWTGSPEDRPRQVLVKVTSGAHATGRADKSANNGIGGDPHEETTCKGILGRKLVKIDVQGRDEIHLESVSVSAYGTAPNEWPVDAGVSFEVKAEICTTLLLPVYSDGTPLQPNYRKGPNGERVLNDPPYDGIDYVMLGYRKHDYNSASWKSEIYVRVFGNPYEAWSPFLYPYDPSFSFPIEGNFVTGHSAYFGNYNPQRDGIRVVLNEDQGDKLKKSTVTPSTVKAEITTLNPLETTKSYKPDPLTIRWHPTWEPGNVISTKRVPSVIKGSVPTDPNLYPNGAEPGPDLKCDVTTPELQVLIKATQASAGFYSTLGPSVGGAGGIVTGLVAEFIGAPIPGWVWVGGAAFVVADAWASWKGYQVGLDIPARQELEIATTEGAFIADVETQRQIYTYEDNHVTYEDMECLFGIDYPGIQRINYRGADFDRVIAEQEDIYDGRYGDIYVSAVWGRVKWEDDIEGDDYGNTGYIGMSNRLFRREQTLNFARMWKFNLGAPGPIP
jgi:hypothetical protein